jgi:hypothetical protein
MHHHSVTFTPLKLQEFRIELMNNLVTVIQWEAHGFNDSRVDAITNRFNVFGRFA